MKLTAEIIQECQERERAWCAMPRTVAEERQTVALLESMEDRRIIVPNWHVPGNIKVLIESVSAGAQPPAPGPRPQVLTEYCAAPRDHASVTAPRDGTRDVASLTFEEHYSVLHQVATGEANGVLAQLRSVLTEHRDETPSLPADAHRRLAEAFRGAEVEIPPGLHERLARAFGVAR